jgi:polysaccharide deacetylase family protein (PEP-CTERM system associated)
VVEIFHDRFKSSDWEDQKSTLIANTRRILKLFARHDASATFFVIGWAADKFPALMQEIVDHGHEIGCHSYYHRRVDSLTPEEFREDTERAMDAIVRAIGNRPFGYRAPSWSMGEATPWAFETLANLDFLYDSSIFPIKHDLYGLPNGPRELFKMAFDNGKELWELPASTFRILGKNIPLAGGGFFRHSPFWYSRRLIRQLNEKGQPAVVYIHPWEFDPDPPKLDGLTTLQKFRSYSSTSTLLYKFDRLLSSFKFTTIHSYLHEKNRRRIGFQ